MPLWDNVNCTRSLGFLDMYKGGCDGGFSLDVGFFPSGWSSIICLFEHVLFSMEGSRVHYKLGLVLMIFGWNFSSRMFAFEGRDTCSGAALVQCSILLWVFPSLMLPRRIENEVWPVWGLQACTQRCTASKIVLQVISLSYPWTWDLDKCILRIQNSVYVIFVSPPPMKSCKYQSHEILFRRWLVSKHCVIGNRFSDTWKLKWSVLKTLWLEFLNLRFTQRCFCVLQWASRRCQNNSYVHLHLWVW